jgi:hypothetical protein
MVLLCVALGAALAAGEPREVAAPRADLEGGRLFRARCSTCHDPSRVYHRRASRDGWREIVFRMQRMPQSGITPAEARRIVDYLATLQRAPAAAPGAAYGGRTAFGDEWLSILEVATVTDGRVRLGGREYDVRRDGLRVTLAHGRRVRIVAFAEDGTVAETSPVDSWRIGDTVYELHLVLYEIRGDRIRVGRALRRR